MSILKNNRDPLYGYKRQELIKIIKDKLQGRVKEAYFFGSFATDSMHSDSDLDIMLVKETDTTFVERAFEFSDLLDIIPTMDILVYTPSEFSKLTSNPSVGFWNQVTKSLMRFL